MDAFRLNMQAPLLIKVFITCFIYTLYIDLMFVNNFFKYIFQHPYILAVRPTRRQGTLNIARGFCENFGYHVLQLPGTVTCPYCSAQLLKNETNEICCCKGKIVLPTISSPHQLLQLYTAQTNIG